MASEAAAVSSVHLQQALLALLKFAATVFGSAPQVQKLKYLLKHNSFRQVDRVDEHRPSTQI